MTRHVMDVMDASKNRMMAIVLLLLIAGAISPLATLADGKPAAQPVDAKGVNAGMRFVPDLEYAKVDGVSLQLDLYLPAHTASPSKAVAPPLVVWIHGGGWTEGARRPCPMTWLVGRGYAVASITYRLAPKYIFPAQIEDCKAAIRWLRANAAEYGYDPDRIGLCGESAGGHLVTLLGLTSGTGNKALDGKVGDHLDTSSDVQAVCEMYGPADLTKPVNDHVPGTVDIQKIVTTFLGGSLEEKHEQAVAASPLTYITAKSPPFLIVHGDHDPLVAVDQAWMLFHAMRAAKAPVELWVIPNGSHVFRIRGTPYFEPRLNTFFDAALKHSPTTRP